MENNASKENGSALKQRLAELAKHYQQVEVEDVSIPSSKPSNGITVSNSTNISSDTPKSPSHKASAIVSRLSGKTPQTNSSVPPKATISSTAVTKTPLVLTGKTPINTPATPHANNQPLPDECAAAAIANRPVSKVAAIWEQRCREEAAQVNVCQTRRLSNKRRSRSGSPSIGQIAKRAVARTYSPVSTPNDDSSSTGDYQTAASTSESDQIPPPVPPPLHTDPTIILNQASQQQPYYGSHQRSSSNVQERRMDFESKLAALGFEMVGRPGQGGGIASVDLTSPSMTVRAEPAVGVAKAEVQTNRLPPSGASRGNVRQSPAQKKQQQSSSDDEESSSEEDIDQLVSKARQHVEEVVRQEIDNDISEEEQESAENDEVSEEDEEDSDEIVPMPPPPPPPRGRSFGGGTYNSDAVSTDSTSAWNSMEDIHAASSAVDRRRSGRHVEEGEEDEHNSTDGDAIDSLSFASSSEENTSESQSSATENKNQPAQVTSRKSSAKEVKKEAWVEERERDLKRQLVVQDGVIQQTMKALLECQFRRQEHLASAKKKSKLAIGTLFGGATKVEPLSASSGLSGCTVGSLAEAEFYRVLLIANERRKAIHSELRRLSSRRATIVDRNDVPPVTVTISDIQLQLKHEFRMRQINSGDSAELYYFVVLLRHGPTVLHTVCIGTDEARDGCIQFPNMLQFSDVRAVGGGEGESRDNELNMKISIYGLTLPRDVPASYDVSSKHRKTGSHHHGSLSPNASSVVQPGSGISTPFYCVDSASITREIVRQAATSSRGLASVSLHCMPSKWPLMPSVKFKARCALSAPIEHSGFLTLFTTSSGGSLPAWHRRWAHLRTTEVFFYMEPDAEPSQPSPPLPVFDLHNACSSAEVLTQYTCARPNTLELILNNGGGGSTSSATSQSSVTSSYDTQSHQSRLWFAADTRNDLYEWRSAINRALSAIKLWGLLGTNQQPNQQQINSSGSSNSALGGDTDQPLQSRV